MGDFMKLRSPSEASLPPARQSMSLGHRPRRRGASGFTLIELLLTLGVIAIVMIPLFAFTMLTMRQGSDQGTAADTAAFTQLSQFLHRDVASSATAFERVPGGDNIADPCPVAPAGEGFDPNVSTAWLRLRSTDGTDIIYLSEATGDGTRLLRRSCGLDENGDRVSEGTTVLAENLDDVPGPPDAPETADVPISIDCKPRPGRTTESDRCGEVAVTVRGEKLDPVTVRAVRRVAPRNDDNSLPSALITCSPDCKGVRNSDQNFVVQLDGSLSTSPAGVSQFVWALVNLDGTETVFSADAQPAPYEFNCPSGSPRWNAGAKGCAFQVRLTIIDNNSATDTATATIFVRNALPTVALAPEQVAARRAVEVEFNTGGTLDPDGTGLCYEWDFNDPASAADTLEWCTGDPEPAGYSVAARTDAVTNPTPTPWEPGLWFYTYTTIFPPRTGSVTVTDADGESVTRTFSVATENAPPVADIRSSTGDRLLDIPTGPIVWNGDQSYDPDGLLHDPSAPTIPSGANAGRAQVSSYEWSLTNEDGSSLFLLNGELARSTDPNWTFEGFNEYGVFILTLRVTDAEGAESTTTRSITVNKAPRAIVTVSPSDPAVITPANGQTSFTLDGSQSFDPDDGGFIVNWRWYIWSAAGPAVVPTELCSASQAPPCIIDGGNSPALQIGPSTTPPVPFGSYRVQLIVTDDNGELSLCQDQSPYTTNCEDARSEFQPMGPSWVELKINQPPTVPAPGFAYIPNLGDGADPSVRRETNLIFSVDPGAVDPDGTIASYEWTFTRIGGGELGMYPTNLNVANPTVRFFPVAPTNTPYQVRANLRVTDNDGGFTVRERTFWVRNRPPVAGITVVNSQTAAIHNVPNYPVWTTADPVNEPARFRIDAGASQDLDGQIQSRLWRIWRVNADSSRTQLAEFGDNNSGGTTCQVSSGSPILLSTNCFVFEYEFTEYGEFVLDLEVRDNDDAINRTEAVVRVNHPPVVTLATTPASGVATPSNTFFSFGFTPTANDSANGGTITTYTYDWGDGVDGAASTSVRTNANFFTRRFDAATLNSDGTCATNTGQCGQWLVTLRVTNNTLGTASVQVLLRINQRPIAWVVDPYTGERMTSTPIWRINCPSHPTIEGSGLCTMPPWDASVSEDPDSSEPLAEYRWFDNNGDLLAASPDPIAPPVEFPLSYSGATGRSFTLVVVDADGAASTARTIRIAANRPPRNVSVTAPAGSQPVAVQRNVLTGWTGTAQDDEPQIDFVWRFETLAGDPIPFRTEDGDIVTSLRVPSTGTGTTKTTNVSVAFPDTVPGTTGRAVLSAIDRITPGVDNPEVVNGTEFLFIVVDADPVAVIDWVNPVAPPNPAVFTSDQVTPPAFSFVVTGENSFDPDSGPGGTPGPVVAYNWIVQRLSPSPATIGDGCSTGRINSPDVGAHACTLPPIYGNYRVTLIVYDAGDRTGTATWDIRVNRAPEPTFTATPSTVTGLTTPVTFNAAGSIDPDGTIASYTWDFGDGTPPQTVTGAGNTTIQHTFTTYPPGGFRTVTLTVTDNNGGTASTTRLVRVNEAPNAVITAVRANGGACDAGPQCAVNPPEPYTVSFDSLASVDPDGSLVDHEWTFTGPGWSESFFTIGPFDVDFPGPGLFEVTLTVTDNDGGTGTATLQIKVNQPPTAALAGDDPLQLQRGVAATLDAGGSSDPDGTIVAYTWEFLDEAGVRIGDVVTVPAATFDVSFNQLVPAPPATGTGTIVLTVTDDDGATDTLTRAFTVGNQPPVVIIETTPDPPTITPENDGQPQVVELDASGSFDPDGPPLVSFEWVVTNLADSSTTSLSGPVIEIGPGSTPAFASGTYDVVLTVTDVDADSTTSDPLTVRVNDAPTAVASVAPTLVNPPDAPVITLDGSGSTDADGSIESYQWRIVGPNSYDEIFNGVSPAAVTLPGAGTFTVALMVTDNDGGIGVASETVRVNEAPTPVILIVEDSETCTTATDPGGCVVNAPYAITLDGTDSSDDLQIVTYEWEVRDEDDDVVGSGNQPTVALTLPGPGVYSVRLTVGDNEGATATIEGTIDANAPPQASIAGDDPIEVLRDLDVVFDGSATSDPDGDSIVSYRWTLFDVDGTQILESEPFSTPTFVWSSAVLIPVPPETGQGTVRLTAIDQRGGVGVVEKGFVVRNQAPVPVITPTPLDLVNEPGFTPSFSPAGTDDPDGMVMSGVWEVFEVGGDPAPIASEPADLSVDPEPFEYTFDDFGSFVVRLTVTDNDGETGVAEVTVKINQPPVAGIRDAGSLTVPVGVEFEFDGSEPDYSFDPDGTIPVESYIWLWEGPAFIEPAFGENRPRRTFAVPGTYTVRLFLTDDDGALGEATTTIEVSP